MKRKACNICVMKKKNRKFCWVKGEILPQTDIRPVRSTGPLKSPSELMELTLREKQCSLHGPIFRLQAEQNTTFKSQPTRSAVSLSSALSDSRIPTMLPSSPSNALLCLLPTFTIRTSGYCLRTFRSANVYPPLQQRSLSHCPLHSS